MGSSILMCMYLFLQTDFANEFLGGGVLFQGNVQEEIRFSVCPELLSSMLFMECMAPNEAIIFQGFEQFSNYKGYGGHLEFGGDFVDNAAKDKAGDILTSIVAIDAVPYMWTGEISVQYTPKYFMRDINKSYAGFLQPETSTWPADTKPRDEEDKSWVFDLDTNYKRAIATGNWGCGAFGGDPQFKSMLQWVAITYARCPALIYYTFHDRSMEELPEVIDKITSEQWTVKKLFTTIAKFGDGLETRGDDEATFFEYLLDS